MVKFFFYFGVATASVLGLIAVGLGLFLVTTPRPSDIRDCIVTKMYHVHLCPKDASYTKIKDISMAARNAVVVSEDGAFYSHHGFDWDEMRTSFHADLDKGQMVRGGSTITQQLAKNVYLTSEKSVLRKLREALITVQLEDELSKDEILEKYLNVVEFGPDLYGIGNASRHYFSKPPSQLNVAEGAFLAFLLPSPKKYAVSFEKRQLTRFANHQVTEIVNRLYRFHKINEEEHAAAMVQVGTLFGSSALDFETAAPGSDETPDDDSGVL